MSSVSIGLGWLGTKTGYSGERASFTHTLTLENLLTLTDLLTRNILFVWGLKNKQTTVVLG